MGEGETQVQQVPPDAATRQPPHTTARSTRERRDLWMGLGLGAFCVLVVAALALVVYASNQQIAAAASAARAYCADVQAKHYDDAYKLLSPSAQATTSAQVYKLRAADADAIDGAATTCTVPTPGFAFLLAPNPSSTAVAATITRQHTRSGSILLAKNGGTWQVAGESASLQGTDVMPLVTAQLYCQNLAQGNYAAAYASTTQAYQSRVGTVSAYSSSIKSALGEAQATIQGCQMRYNTYTVNASDTTASVQWMLDITVGAVATPTTQTVTFIKSGATWKIDSIG